MSAQARPEPHQEAVGASSPEAARAVWEEVLKAAWTLQSFRTALHEASGPGGRASEALGQAMARVAEGPPDRAGLDIIEDELRRAQIELEAHLETLEGSLEAVEGALKALWEARQRTSR